MTIDQDQGPNFREDGKLYLVRCYACVPERGRENNATAVASGTCATCGHSSPRKHVAYKCPPDCEIPYCAICEGGLFSCVTCNCGEGTLPAECPGESVSMEMQDLIISGKLDFRDGQWVTL